MRWLFAYIDAAIQLRCWAAPEKRGRVRKSRAPVHPPTLSAIAVLLQTLAGDESLACGSVTTAPSLQA